MRACQSPSWLTSGGGEPLKLSILLPTHRSDLTAISRIAQVCSWAGPDVEVVVRDNSGDAKKRDVIARFQSEHCRVISVDPCTPLENFSTLLRLAKGEFIFWPADDDFSFDRAIKAIPDALEKVGKDPSIVGVTGHYVVETSYCSSIASYTGTESDDPLARVAGYLNYGGPNVFTYSVLRRTVAERMYQFLTSMPFYFSFHDQITCLLYLLNGKFLKLERLLYCYDMGPWQSPETAQAKDIDYYKAAGLDPIVNKLHWFLGGFEGAVLIRNADVFPDYPLNVRQAVADQWFSMFFLRFKGQPRLPFESPLLAEADKICAKLLTSSGQLSFQDMLAEIKKFLALSSPAHAQKYFDFWDAIINRRSRAPLPRAAAGGR